MHGFDIIRSPGVVDLSWQVCLSLCCGQPTDYVLYIAKGSGHQRFMRQPCLVMLKFDSCVITSVTECSCFCQGKRARSVQDEDVRAVTMLTALSTGLRALAMAY